MGINFTSDHLDDEKSDEISGRNCYAAKPFLSEVISAISDEVFNFLKSFRYIEGKSE